MRVGEPSNQPNPCNQTKSYAVRIMEMTVRDIPSAICGLRFPSGVRIVSETHPMNSSITTSEGEGEVCGIPGNRPGAKQAQIQ